MEQHGSPNRKHLLIFTKAGIHIKGTQNQWLYTLLVHLQK